MARKRYEDRRDEILRAAVKVIIARGFGDVSVRDLTGELQVSSGLLHHYFGSLDELLVEAFRLVAEGDLAELTAAIDPVADPLHRLDQYLTFGVPASHDRSYSMWVDAWTESLHLRALRQPVAELNHAWHEVLAQILVDADRDGSCECHDPDGTAWAILGLLDGLAVQVIVHSSIDRAEMLRLMRSTSEAMLGLEPGSLESRGLAELRPARPGRKLRPAARR